MTEILDVISTLHILALVPEPVDDQRHEVVARLEVGGEVMVAGDGVRCDPWLARELLDEVRRLCHVAVDLDVVVVTAIDVHAVHVVASVEDLFDPTFLERVIGEVDDVQSLCIAAEVSIGDGSETPFQRHAS